MQVLFINAGAKSSGATQQILLTAQNALVPDVTSQVICLGERNIGFCKGCMSCYETGTCAQRDEMESLMDAIDAAQVLVIAAPSYWADVPGQFKVFIDRCTVYGDTNPHPSHRALRSGKVCYAFALRAGKRPMECEHIIETIAHWCGHMNILLGGSMYFCGISRKEDISPYQDKIIEQMKAWMAFHPTVKE